MDTHRPLRDLLIARLESEVGPPVLRGDCCWWTLSRPGRRPLRISVFIDGDDNDAARGWICDLESTTASEFIIGAPADIDPLLARIRRGLAAAPAPTPAAHPTPVNNPPSVHHPPSARVSAQSPRT